jgi:hypothetical protein
MTSSYALKDTSRLKENYVDVYRREVDEFKVLFKFWALDLKQLNKEYLEDEWDLF